MSPLNRTHVSIFVSSRTANLLFRFAIVLLLLLMFAPPALASPLRQASANTCYTIADDAGRLVAIERLPTPIILGSTELTRNGSPTSDELESLAFNFDGTFLYSAFQNDPNDKLDGMGDSILVTIDPGSGVVMDIGTSLNNGTMDDTFSGSLGSITSGQVTGLAIQKASGDLVLWAVAKFAGPGGDSSIVYQVDPASGKHVSDAFGTGVDYMKITGLVETGRQIVEDIAISPAGAFYIETHQRLYTFDPTNGVAALVGAFDPESIQIEGLSFASDGVLYGTQGESKDQNNELDTIDITTAARTKVLDLPTYSSEGDYEALACLILADLVIDQTADLSVSMVADRASYSNGGLIVYTVVASNAGPLSVSGALVESNKPTLVDTWDWACTALSGGADACTPTAGPVPDNFSDIIDLPAGGSVTYTVTANINVSATLTISTLVQITPPVGVVDPVLENNLDFVNTTRWEITYYFPMVIKEPPLVFRPFSTQ